MESPFSLASRQLWRGRRRAGVAAIGVAFAALLMLMQLGFRDALFDGTVRLHDRVNAQLVLIGPESSFFLTLRPFTRLRLQQAAGVAGVASTGGLFIGFPPYGWRNPATDEVRGICVLAFDLDDPVLSMPDVAGQLDKLGLPDVILFDSLSRREYGPVAERLRAGTPVTSELNRRKVTVVGLFELGTSFGVDGNVITSEANFYRIHPARVPGEVDVGLVRLAPGADRESVRRALVATLPGDVLVLTREEWIAREKAYWNGSTPIGFIFAFGSVMGFIVGAVIVYQILFADVSEHLPEYATLKAMGFTNGFLSLVVLAEAALLAVLGYLPGALVSMQLCRMTAAATRLPMGLSPRVALTVLGLTFLMCAISGLLALRRLRSADPAEVF